MQELLTNKTIDKLKYDLVREGLISYEALSRAEEMSKSENMNLAQVLIMSNLISEERLLEFIEVKLHIPSVNLKDYTLDRNCLQYISLSDARKYRIIPLFKIEDVLTIAMADPLDLFVVKNIIHSANCKIEPIICSESNILETIEMYYAEDESETQSSAGHEDVRFDWREELNDEKHDNVQAQRIIRAILYQAVLERVHELYLEHTPEGLTVYYKNGQVAEKGSVPVLLIPLFISQLKIMSSLDPSISEIPQLGKLKFFIDPIYYIASVSAFPTINGERISIKIYKPPKRFDELCISQDNADLIRTNLEKPGLVLVGGSGLVGKTSVIYSLLTSLDTGNKNIMTLESIVKYELPGINQCEFNEKVGFDLNKAMRLIDFQSPDVVYFEGIFTKEGLELAASLVLSNKLVLTEFLADTTEALLARLREDEFSSIRNFISCIIFVHNKDEISIIGKEQL